VKELGFSEMSSAASLRDRELIAGVNVLFLERIILWLKTSRN
jgi:hypothetical protein